MGFHFVGNMGSAIPNELLPFCKLHGEVNDANELNSIYKRTNILLMTSSREGFPMVIMEAMMFGVVVITTNVGGISEHITHHVNGFLINETDEEKIVKEAFSVINYLNNNKDVLNKISEQAYQYAKTNFGKDKFTKAYQSLLKIDE